MAQLFNAYYIFIFALVNFLYGQNSAASSSVYDVVLQDCPTKVFYWNCDRFASDYVVPKTNLNIRGQYQFQTTFPQYLGDETGKEVTFYTLSANPYQKFSINETNIIVHSYPTGRFYVNDTLIWDITIIMPDEAVAAGNPVMLYFEFANSKAYMMDALETTSFTCS